MDNTETLLHQTIVQLQQMNVQLQQRLDDIDLQPAELRQRNNPQPLNSRLTT